MSRACKLAVGLLAGMIFGAGTANAQCTALDVEKGRCFDVSGFKIPDSNAFLPNPAPKTELSRSRVTWLGCTSSSTDSCSFGWTKYRNEVQALCTDAAVKRYGPHTPNALTWQAACFNYCAVTGANPDPRIIKAQVTSAALSSDGWANQCAAHLDAGNTSQLWAGYSSPTDMVLWSQWQIRETVSNPSQATQETQVRYMLGRIASISTTKAFSKSISANIGGGVKGVEVGIAGELKWENSITRGFSVETQQETIYKRTVAACETAQFRQLYLGVGFPDKRELGESWVGTDAFGAASQPNRAGNCQK